MLFSNIQKGKFVKFIFGGRGEKWVGGLMYNRREKTRRGGGGGEEGILRGG